MPKVELLRIVFETEHNETLMILTPNVKTLLIGGTFNLPALNFKAMATHLKSLENLGLYIYSELDYDSHSNYILDSVITGCPITICKKMSAQLQDKKELPQQTVASFEQYRTNFSILDLKGKERLTLYVIDVD